MKLWCLLNVLSDPKQLIADPAYWFEASDHHSSHQTICNHAALRLLGPNLIPLIRRHKLVQPHPSVHRNGYEERSPRPAMEEVVMLI